MIAHTGAPGALCWLGPHDALADARASVRQRGTAGERRAKLARSVIVRREFAGHVWLAGPELEYLPQHSRSHRGNRIDAKYRLAWRTNHLVGHADQPLVAAAAEEKPHDRNLAEHVVQPVHGNEGAAHAHLVSRIIDVALDRRSDGRAFHHVLPDRDLAFIPGEFRTKPRECNPGLSARRPSRGYPIQRTLPFHREVANVDQPVLCARLDGGRRDGELKLATDHLGVSVRETEERAGVVGVEIDQVPALALATHISDQRRIAAKLAAQREISDHAIAPRQLTIEAAQSLAEITGDSTELQIEIDIDILGLALGVCLPARNRRFDEAATVEYVAAHCDFQDTIRATFGFERGLVAFGWRIGREIRREKIAVLVDLQRSLDQRAGAFDDDVFKPRRLRLLHDVKSRAPGLAGQLDPAGQNVVELQ